MLDKLYRYINLVLLGLIIIIGTTELSIITYLGYNAYVNYKINKIYEEILIASGQTQDSLPLEISDIDVENAFNDGNRVVIYMGLVNNTSSWDEVALVLGHEVAHGMLYHLDLMDVLKLTNNKIGVLEANADKMGAFYMMKAGYDVCKGRELFKHWIETKGDALEQNHPPNSYRYIQLNVNCGDV